MRYNKLFNANFKSFVIFSAVCFFFQFSFADDSLCTLCKNDTVCNCQEYCEVSADLSTSKVKSGCGGKYGSGSILTYPEFEPKWTSAIENNIGIKGQEYMMFELEGGMNYRWTTYDSLEDFDGGVQYYKSCSDDTDCGSQMKCLGSVCNGTVCSGNCMWPFDTELTLIDTENSTKGCDNGTVVAFSRTGGYENQSALEYKAPRDMRVILLVTNYKYNSSTKKFESCQNSNVGGEKKTTTVKWQRYILDHCATCGNSLDYAFNEDSPKVDPSEAPNWSEVQAFEFVDLPNFEEPTATENWLKPGSYVDFNVEEGKIYRWATCKSVFSDTQLTLFKPDGDEGCGKFLAFNDDSETSYFPKNPWDQAGNAYCPSGTKQSVLEWHANFTGKVRILFNEYNCSQCNRDNNSSLHWSQCFRVTEDYVFGEDGDIAKDETTGFPVVADSSTASSEKETLTYLYSFPLDWQRYDCHSCNGTAVGYVYDFCGYGKLNGSCSDNVCESWSSDKTVPFCTESGETVTCGGTVDGFQSGSYATFALRRGSKYVFEASGSNDVIITVKAGEDCINGRTLAQGIGQVAYFAETSAECFDDEDDPNQYSDVVTVLVSDPECDNTTPSTILFKYSYYPDPLIKFEKVENAANVKNRFNKVTVDTKFYYEDTATGIRFVEPESYAATWEQAINVCKDYVVGGGSGAITCPDPICPEPTTCGSTYCYTLEDSGPNTCVAKNDTCPSPTCNKGYEPYLDSYEGGVKKCNLHPELCGLCISSATGTNCNKEGSNGKCATSNTCVTKEPNIKCRNVVGVSWGCPSAEYTPISATDDYCYTTEGAEDLYDDDELDSYLADDDNGHTPATAYGLNGSSCPEGTTYNSAENVCKIDNCGTYTELDNADMVIKGTRKYGVVKDRNKCYKDSSLSDGEVPCCCDEEIKVYNKTTHNQALSSTIPRPVIYYATEIKLGQVTAFQQMSCQKITPCASGYTFLNNDCYKCEDGFAIYNNGTSLSCGQNSCNATYTETEGGQTFHHCVTCPDGGTPRKVGDQWQCLSCEGDSLLTSDNRCKINCSAGYEKDDKCYPKALKEYTCDVGWIEKDGYCRKIDGVRSYPDCSSTLSSNMVSVDDDHTCRNGADDYAPNTIDCMCKIEKKCGIGTVEKTCPTAVCMVNGKPVNAYSTMYGHQIESSMCIGKDKYQVTKQKDANGNIVCSFTDLSSNETCGQPSKGWTLPDVNQLYSLVDFDLYDPATPFPFKGGTYKRNICASNSDCSTGYTCDTTTGKCVKTCSADTDCSSDGAKYICVNGKCAENNWFWSSTTVLNKNTAEEGKFVWAVNMEDGRSYRVLKGCYDPDPDDDNDECADFAAAGLHATPYQVMCIKGSTLASLFHSGLPQTDQIFSGWACDKDKKDNILDIYFEIIDSNGINVSTLFEASGFVTIPGTTVKGVKYGATDITPVVDSDDYFKIKQNCNGAMNKTYVFNLDLNNPGSKGAVATAIKSIEGYGKPPYYVTAYAVDTTINTAAIVQPSKERFVLKNKCGDAYKTFDGEYTENCEQSDFEAVCKYTSPWSEDPEHMCQICNPDTCLWTDTKVPGCGDKILQSKYCVKTGTGEQCGNTDGENCKVNWGEAVYATGHPYCEYYDFAVNNFGTWTEQCDCGNAKDVYLLVKNNDGSYSCSTPLDEDKCPETQYYNGIGDPNCVICNMCSVDKTKRKPYCGDGVKHASEACDDGNLSDSDDCLTTCEEAKCGDGKVRLNPENPANAEVCDNGENLNGTYVGLDGKPGCSADCKAEYKCGDGIIQNSNCAAKCSACNSIADAAKKAECQNIWCGDKCVTVTGATEECDEGNFNGRAITYQRFIDSLNDEWKNKCSAELNGTVYPISNLQNEFSNCLAKYKVFVEEHGCSDTCSKSNVKYCGDGILQSGEVCDQGYDTTKGNFNGKGFSGGCALDCQFEYGCGNGIIERADCIDSSLVLECADSTDPAVSTARNTIGFEYSGEIISGSKEHVSSENVLLFVNIVSEDCDAGISNNQYGVCNASCSGKPYCGDKSVSEGVEDCDLGLGNGGNRTIEDAWSEVKGGTCIGVFNQGEGSEERNVCTDSKDNWAGLPCCTFGRWCGDGVVDNVKDGVGSTDESGNISNLQEWRSSADKWTVHTPQALYSVAIDDLDLGVQFTTRADDTYGDVELDIKIPIVKGYRYFVEYDVNVSNNTVDGSPEARMHAGAKMYDASGTALPQCVEIVGGTVCSDNPLFFVANDETELDKDIWINKKNATPIVLTDSDVSSDFNWKKDTSYIKLYFQFKGKRNTSFIVRGLKVYTLESGKGNPGGTGAKEMCDNGDANLDVAAAKADTSYMSGCTKYVKKEEGVTEGQAGCQWTNYCGDSRKHSVEECDNGNNETNVYNGCEPGCTEIGPHCGDGILDVKADKDCPFTKPDEGRCDDLAVCIYTVTDWDKCNLVSKKYDGDTYDAQGNFTGKVVTFVSENCDNSVDGNTNLFMGTKGEASEKIREDYLDINNYGKCRTDCTFARCGDGILDYIVRTDSDGTPKEKNGTYDYVEECDCGIVKPSDGLATTAAALLLPIPAGYADNEAYALNQKSDGVYVCKGADGKYYPNSNYSGKAGASCRSNCTISRCGDGIKDQGEYCDDGNGDDHDDCTNNCQLNSSCGDGIYSFKRSYLCEELLDLKLDEESNGKPSMETMRDRGVIDCCDDNDTACKNEGTPLCSDLVDALKSDETNKYGLVIPESGRFAIHHWFEKGIMHCCFNKKYETGKDTDDDSNCINSNHTPISSTLQGYVKKTCTSYQVKVDGAYVEPWENCDTASYSERCELCDLNNPRCACDTLELTGAAMTKCLNECKKDPCGCVAYCEYKNPAVAKNCKTLNPNNEDNYIDCVKTNLSDCVSECTNRNAYCDMTDHACWDRNGACGDGIVASKNEECDNYESVDVSGHAAGYYTFDGIFKATPVESLQAGRGGKYCTGEKRTSDTTSESPMCADESSTTCWEVGCTVRDHGSGSLSKCGDGKKDVYAGETCDEGWGSDPNLNGFYGHCNKECSGILAICGNGIQESGTDQRGMAYNEVCDLGDPAEVSGGKNGKYALNLNDSCNKGCDGQGAGGYCGDGTIQNKTYSDCKSDGTDSQGLVCKSGVDGAAETCDPGDARTQSLKNAEVPLEQMCSNCVQYDTCGNGTRNPRFEGCDCGNSNGSGECTVTSYGSLRTYDSSTGVRYNCFSGCKSDPIGNVNVHSMVEISGWACDPDHPMEEHPADLVVLEFYGADDPSTPMFTNYTTTNKDVSPDVIKACGGGSKHGFFYNPKTQGTGVTDVASQSPITVKVYVKSIDKNKNSSSPETELVQIGQASFTLGQSCGDGKITKCHELDITKVSAESETGYESGTGLIKHNWKCVNEGGSCDTEECVVVAGNCDSYGLEDGKVCLDENCDEGKANNGADKRCSNGIGSSARECDYNYCGDGAVQQPNGKAFEHSELGYKDEDDGYLTYTPQAFSEECESGTKACKTLFTESCTSGETPTGCVPSGATVEGTSSCNTGACKWKRDGECSIKHDCPSLESAAIAMDFGWSSSANAISYVSGSSAKYTRTWNSTSNKWEPAAPTATDLIHNTQSGTSAQNSCKFKCKDDNSNTTQAKFQWDSSTGKCKGIDGYVTCSTCSDSNAECSVDGWKTVKQTISVSNGVVTQVPASAPTPEYKANPTTPYINGTDCTYKCKSGSSYAPDASGNKKCRENDLYPECTGLPDHAVWALVSDTGGGTFAVSKATSTPTVHQTLNTATGAYSPSTAAVYATKSNIVSGSTVITNKCYFMCEKGAFWNGNVCSVREGADGSCGDGVVNSINCSNPNATVEAVQNGSEILGDVTIDRVNYKCYYEPNPENQEQCDDKINGVSKNGQYLTSPVYDSDYLPRSACNKDCTGRIMQDSTHPRGEFFCGDGIVQTKNDTDKNACTNFELTCKLVTGGGSGQYPGIGYSGGTDISEQCDYNDSKISDSVAADTKRQRLCKRAFGDRTYYAAGSPTCNDSCQISARKGTDCQWCGDGTKNGSEGCDNGSDNTDTAPSCAYGNQSCSYCTTSCVSKSVTGTWCGDGIPQSGEECDKGSSNTDTAPSCGYNQTCEYCTKSCKKKTVKGHYCGDGTLDSSYEECDGTISGSCLDRTSSISDDCGSCDDYTTYKYRTCNKSCGNDCKVKWSCETETSCCSDSSGCPPTETCPF